VQRRFPAGCEILEAGTHFRVWAPKAKRVDVTISGGPSFALEAEAEGFFSGFGPAAAGSLYRFSLDGNSQHYPDPASRFQPEGPFGWSQVVDPKFPWTDSEWPGVRLEGQVLYEMHIGTFTREGTWAAATEQLPELAALGISILEVMPVADFDGLFGWGYDGVDLFAPTRLYGTPDDFRKFVDAAHANGLGVILDVVYNHLGPAGNFLGIFSPDYFSTRHKTDWGEAINFDGPNSRPVREFFLANAAYWIDEFHLDGLRIDATQNIYDDNSPHIVQEIGRVVRAAAKGRDTILVAENEPQDSRLLRPTIDGGYGLDAAWNDDFHHTAMVALTGRSEAYYTDYSGRSQELLSTMKHGFLYQGQYYSWQKNGRGVPSLDIAPSAFVNFLQNHDQVANSARGLRLHQLTSPGRLRAMTALLLLAPGTPMLFQGQEFSARGPFLYFANHGESVAPLVSSGRVEFLAQFRSMGEALERVPVPDPGDQNTFERSKLDFEDRTRNAEIYALHRDLLRLRREDAVFQNQGPGGLDGSVLTDQAFLVRFFGERGDDRLLFINLGRDLTLPSIGDPLVAPPRDMTWKVLISTESPKYGGGGAAVPFAEGAWRIPGEAAVLLSPDRKR